MRNILKIVLKANGSDLGSMLNRFYSHVIKFTDPGTMALKTSQRNNTSEKIAILSSGLKISDNKVSWGFPTVEMSMSGDVSSFIFLTFTEKQRCLKLNILNPFPIIESLLYS